MSGLRILGVRRLGMLVEICMDEKFGNCMRCRNQYYAANRKLGNIPSGTVMLLIGSGSTLPLFWKRSLNAKST